MSFYTDTGEGPSPATAAAAAAPPAGREERPRSPPRRQRACLPCMKSKARCKFESNSVDNGCERYGNFILLNYALPRALMQESVVSLPNGISNIVDR